jgi:hypothetical protein
MMDNPLEVFFGRDVLSKLRDQPSALRRVADAVKPLLMANVHPDRDVTLGGLTAAEISEAHLVLKSAEPEQIGAWVTEILTKDRNEIYKLQLRDAKQKIEALEQKVANVQTASKNSQKVARHTRAPKQLSESNEVLRKVLWEWILSSVNKVPPTRKIKYVRRSALHHMRVVVKYNDGHRGYEFNLAGEVRRTICAISQKEASTAFLFKGDDDAKMRFVTNKYNHSILLGSANNTPKNIPEELATGVISPMIAIGMIPVFVDGFLISRPFDLIDSEQSGGKIVAFVPIRRARAELKDRRKKPLTNRQLDIQLRIRQEVLRREALGKAKAEAAAIV